LFPVSFPILHLVKSVVILFQMLEMCRGRQDWHRTAVEVSVREGIAVPGQLSIGKMLPYFPGTAAATM